MSFLHGILPDIDIILTFKVGGEDRSLSNRSIDLRNQKKYITHVSRKPLPPSGQARRYEEEPGERSKGESNNLKTLELSNCGNRLCPYLSLEIMRRESQKAVPLAKALWSTEVKVAADTFQWIADFLSAKKEEAKKGYEKASQ